MIVKAMEDFEKLSFSEKAAFFNRLTLYPALSLMAWCHPDMGSRLLVPNAGITALFMFAASMFIPERNDRILFFGFATLTLLASLVQRFKRWREFRRGVRQHSYYLGTAGSRWWLPKFLCRRRWPERFFEPVVFVGIGIAITKIAPFTGYWVVLSGLCIGLLEHLTRRREEDEQRDMVDGLIKAELQTDTVERFSEPAPASNRPAQRSGAIPTGLGSDIAHKLKRRA